MKFAAYSLMVNIPWWAGMAYGDGTLSFWPAVSIFTVGSVIVSFAYDHYLLKEKRQ